MAGWGGLIQKCVTQETYFIISCEIKDLIEEKIFISWIGRDLQTKLYWSPPVNLCDPAILK